MATKYGVFSESGILKPGADYLKEQKKDVKKEAAAAAATEKAGFKSGQAPRTGKLNDATFSQFTSTNVCVPYEDSHRSQRGGAASTSKSAGKAEAKSETAFKPASPMKKSSAPQAGDDYGMLGKTVHVVATAPAPLKKGEVKSQPRGIFTTVPKSGGYGTNKFTLSERQGAKGVAGEYEYMADPIPEASPAVKGKEEKGVPFRPSRSANNAFGQYEYLSNPPGDENQLPKKGEEDKKKAEPPAFKPANVWGRKLEPVPYMANPLPEHKPQPKGKEEKAWHPAAWSKTDATRSIVRMNL